MKLNRITSWIYLLIAAIYVSMEYWGMACVVASLSLLYYSLSIEPPKNP
jgi:hypothetical protein